MASAAMVDLGSAIASAVGDELLSSGKSFLKKKIRGVGNQGARRAGRPKGSKNKPKRRGKRTKYKRKKNMNPGRSLANLTHGGIQKHYMYNSLKYCVTEENKMYNVGRHQITTDPEHHFSDFYKLHDSFTIENNGYNIATGAVGTSDFTGTDVTLYSNLDYTHGVGKYNKSTVPSTIAPESDKLTEQIFQLRTHYKLWKKEMITFTIRWSTMVNNLQQLEIPEGYYIVVPKMRVKDKLSAAGSILTDNALDSDVFRTDVRLLSDYQALQRMYGIPESAESAPTAAGAFPNAANMVGLTPMPQEEFTYENVARNPGTKWKKIPRKRVLKISEVYKNPYSLTTKSNIFQDPIILFVFKQVPKSWLQQTLHTTGQVAATGSSPTYGTGWKSTTGSSGPFVQQGNDTYLQVGETSLFTSPEFSTDVVSAAIATMKIAHCYSFKNRIEDIVKIPDDYPYLGEKVPY